MTPGFFDRGQCALQALQDLVLFEDQYTDTYELVDGPENPL